MFSSFSLELLTQVVGGRHYFTVKTSKSKYFETLTDSIIVDVSLFQIKETMVWLKEEITSCKVNFAYFYKTVLEIETTFIVITLKECRIIRFLHDKMTEQREFPVLSYQPFMGVHLTITDSLI